MALSTTKGSLVIVDGNTSTPSVFWKGKLVEGVQGIALCKQKVVLRIATDPELQSIYDEMTANNVLLVAPKVAV